MTAWDWLAVAWLVGGLLAFAALSWLERRNPQRWHNYDEPTRPYIEGGWGVSVAEDGGELDWVSVRWPDGRREYMHGCEAHDLGIYRLGE